jgi:eukaryotic-like serine/threonine-protein kinase
VVQLLNDVDCRRRDVLDLLNHGIAAPVVEYDEADGRPLRGREVDGDSNHAHVPNVAPQRYLVAAMAHAVGQVLGGRYEILEVLKPGGQGEIYRVCDHNLDTIAVMKLIDLGLLPGGVWDEAQALNRLADDHILPILNADIVAGQPFIVTALAQHGTLETALEGTGNLGLPVDDVLEWIRQACTGVARAHDASLAHNDIKPANLFLGAKRQCLVGDFGLASLLPPPPMVGLARGASPETAAPEVSSVWSTGAPPACVETDVYSLGATAFWLLSGQPTVNLTGVVGMPARMAAAAAHTPPRLRDVAPHVPAAVAAVVEKAMKSDPNDRHRSVNDLAAALGSRSAKARRWRRTDEHAGHVRCWKGEQKGRSTYFVCLEHHTKPMRQTVTARYSNGARIHGGVRTCSTSDWALAVRVTIDKLS